MGEGLLGHVAVTSEPITSPDVRKNPLYINAREATRSEMVAPIISNTEVIGAFDLESDELNAYSEDDLQVLMLLAFPPITVAFIYLLFDRFFGTHFYIPDAG